MSEDLKTVASFSTPIEAEMARNRLETEGIRAFIADDNTVGWLWHFGTALQGVKVLVAQSDLTRAAELLVVPRGRQAETDGRQAGVEDAPFFDESGLDATAPPRRMEPGRTWTCPKCSVGVDLEMDVCWACGTASDGTEDPEFERADAPVVKPPGDEGEERGPPHPLVALAVVLFAAPFTIAASGKFLLEVFQIDALGIVASSPVVQVVVALLMGAEFLAIIAVFQWYYYMPRCEEEEPDALAEAEAEEELSTEQQWEATAVELDAAARRACLAAILGIAFCPPLLNCYSVWLVVKYDLLGETARQQCGALIYCTVLLNTLLFLLAFLFLIAVGGFTV